MNISQAAKDLAAHVGSEAFDWLAGKSAFEARIQSAIDKECAAKDAEIERLRAALYNVQNSIPE